MCLRKSLGNPASIKTGRPTPTYTTSIIGHFRVPKTLTFKMRPGAKNFLVKMSFICMRMKNDFHIKGRVATLDLKQRPAGIRKWLIEKTLLA